MEQDGIELAVLVLVSHSLAWWPARLCIWFAEWLLLFGNQLVTANLAALVTVDDWDRTARVYNVCARSCELCFDNDGMSGDVCSL